MTTTGAAAHENEGELACALPLVSWAHLASSFVFVCFSVAYGVVAAWEMTCCALVVAVADCRGASGCFWTTGVAGGVAGGGAGGSQWSQWNVPGGGASLVSSACGNSLFCQNPAIFLPFLAEIAFSCASSTASLRSHGGERRVCGRGCASTLIEALLNPKSCAARHKRDKILPFQ